MISVFNENNVGTTADMARRLRQTLPTGWFPTSPPAPEPSVTPVLDGLLAAIASAWSFCFNLIKTTALQTRLATATGSFLDMIATDLFGAALIRKVDEADHTFRCRIEASLVRNRGTRADLVNAVEAVTSAAPFICEPRRAADCGCYGGRGGGDVQGPFGYGVFGLRYGSVNLPFQYLLNVTTIPEFAPGVTCTRQSSATFLDEFGTIRLAAPFVLRPHYEAGVCSRPLLEGRGFNLISDSRSWNGFTQPVVEPDQHSTWFLDESTCGVLKADPVMTVTTTSGERLIGPSIDVAAADSTIVASAWILITSASNVSQVELVATDRSVQDRSVYAKADISLVGKWQRISVSLSLQPAVGRNLRISLEISSYNDSTTTVFTQCWQIEFGTTPTSYIPTNGQFGIREQDDLVIQPSGVSSPSLNLSDVQDGVVAAIPVATTAWISVAEACSA